MSTFAYEALNSEGKLIKGSLEADNVDRARDSVKAQGLTVVSLGAQNALSKDISFDLSKGPSVRDLSVFCRHFRCLESQPRIRSFRKQYSVLRQALKRV